MFQIAFTPEIERRISAGLIDDTFFVRVAQPGLPAHRLESESRRCFKRLSCADGPVREAAGETVDVCGQIRPQL